MERKIGKWKVEEGHEATAGCYPKKKKKKTGSKTRKKGFKNETSSVESAFQDKVR